MQFTKAMIDLAKEIRRRAPSDDKPAIKLANPELFDELKSLYQRNQDAVIKALIKELFCLAGEPWQSQLHTPLETERTILKSYRGQATLVPRPAIAKPDQPSIRSQRIYRGQVVTG